MSDIARCISKPVSVYLSYGYVNSIGKVKNVGMKKNLGGYGKLRINY